MNLGIVLLLGGIFALSGFCYVLCDRHRRYGLGFKKLPRHGWFSWKQASKTSARYCVLADLTTECLITNITLHKQYKPEKDAIWMGRLNDDGDLGWWALKKEVFQKYDRITHGDSKSEFGIHIPNEHGHMCTFPSQRKGGDFTQWILIQFWRCPKWKHLLLPRHAQRLQQFQEQSRQLQNLIPS